MNRTFLIFASIVCTALTANAQTTTVSGTVKDVNGIAYANATVKAQVVTTSGSPVSGQPTVTVNNQQTCSSGGFGNAPCQVPFQGTVGPVAMSGTGSFTLNLQDNTQVTPASTQWLFTVNTPGSAPPLGTGPQVCIAQITISGVSQSVSANFSACPALSNVAGNPNSVGSVINVTNPAYSGCFATVTTGQDWSNCFASIAAAAQTLSFSPVINTFQTQCSNQVASATSLSCNVSIAKGSTVLVGFTRNHPSGQTFSVADSGGNTYSPLGTFYNPGATGIQYIYTSNVGVANAASSVTITDTPAEAITMNVVVYQTGAFGQINLVNTATSAAPASGNVITQDNNNFIVTFYGWFNSGTFTATPNVGNLRSNIAATATAFGGAAVDNTAATPSTITDSITLSGSSPWQAMTVELRSGTPTVPTVYFPPGTYNYASGLNFLLPVSMEGAKHGAYLCYNGPAHAVDWGPTNLVFPPGQPGYFKLPYSSYGIHYTCGSLMTEGIYINNLVLNADIEHNFFDDFGNPNSWGIYANGNQDTLRIINNDYWDDDNIARPWINTFDGPALNQTQFISAVIIGNTAQCVNGRFGFDQCLNPPTLMKLGGFGNLVEGNTPLASFCPAISFPAPVGSAYVNTGSRVVNNSMESDSNSAAGACPQITVGTGVDGLKVIGNYFNLPTGQSAVKPVSGTDLIVNFTFQGNHLTTIAAATPAITLNNLTGQTGNFALQNMCSTTTGVAAAPCSLLHTTGGNITQWNTDYAGTCTITTGACTVYNFQATYAAAPKCTASWTGTGTFTGILKVATSTTQLTITDTVNESTAVISWSCSPDAQ